MTEQTDAAEVEARIAAGRIKHGVGASEDFPGNVCHLVSPIVGKLRLRRRDGSDLPDIGWIIDRLSLVLDMARWEAEHGEAAAEVRGAQAVFAAVEAEASSRSAGRLDVLRAARAAAAAAGGGGAG